MKNVSAVAETSFGFTRASKLKRELGLVQDASTGHEIGQHPDEIPGSDLEAMGHRQCSPLELIRAKCLECCNGSVGEARKCTRTICPLWPVRFGVRPKAWRSPLVGTAARPLRKRNP